MKIGFGHYLEDALVAYIVKQWKSQKIKIGRTVVQKICYFLKAQGVPMIYDFEMHHYGPYSQDLYYRMDELVADNILTDTSATPKWSHYLPGDRADEIITTYHEEIELFKDKIENLLGLFGRFGPTDLELLATIHYFYVTHNRYFRKPPSKNWVIDKVIMAKKDKFAPKLVNDAYDALEVAGLFEWDKI